jgi:hypothetical protein
LLSVQGLAKGLKLAVGDPNPPSVSSGVGAVTGSLLHVIFIIASPPVSVIGMIGRLLAVDVKVNGKLLVSLPL